jgi:hypothetical protein
MNGLGFVYERREFDDKRFSRNAQARQGRKAEANLILSAIKPKTL